jgi:hypothetical protein
MVAHTMSVMLMETLGIVNKEVREDGLMPSILQPDEPSKGYRKNWARFTRLGRNTSVHRNPPALNMLRQVCP